MTLFRVNPPRLTPKTAQGEREEEMRTLVRCSHNRRTKAPVTLAGSVKPEGGKPVRTILAQGPRRLP